MKKLLLSFIMIAIVFFGFSQIKKIDVPESIEIGKIAILGDLQISCEKRGNAYTFFYRDVTFTQVTDFKSFSFKDTDNAFENLYRMILDGFDNPPKEDIMIEIPDGFIWLSFTKAVGIVNFRFGHSVGKTDVIGFSTWLTKKKVDKLFGKA